MANNNNIWTVLKILNTTTHFFKNHNFENPRLNAEMLLSHILNTDRIELYLQFDRILTSGEINQFRELIRRRTAHEPLQYLIGKTEFMGLTLNVSPAVLIPRPETEFLVERTLRLREKFSSKGCWIWDIGTGSGCIAISLAHHWPECHLLATDVSKEALEIAIKNAEINNTISKIDFLQHDILCDESPIKNTIDIIISNPPYISLEEYKNLDPEIRQFEPEIALTDFGSGTIFYHKILSMIAKNLNCKFILLELSGTCIDEVMKIPWQYGFDKIAVFKDYNNLPRVLEITIN